MRTKRAPNSEKKPLPPAPKISLCVVTHYTGNDYHAGRMEITDLCMRSMMAGMGADVELIIWDNGSAPQYREMLRWHEPTIMIESVNVGPHMARRALCHIARGELINLSDDDILYHPDWLAKMLAIYRTFPNVAVVSGSPINIEFRRNWQPAHDWAAKTPGVKVTTGRDLIPQDWERDWAFSIGIASGRSAKTQDETLLEYRGVKAFAQAHHMQMFGPREILAPFMRPVNYLVDFWDIANEISKAGYLQLTTAERTAVHIGNVIDESVYKIAKQWGYYDND
jgi:hypothetical protein